MNRQYSWRFRSAALGMIFALTGCTGITGGVGSIETRSLRQSDPVRLATEFTTTLYGIDEESIASIFLSDLPAEAIIAGDLSEGSVIHIEVLWMPHPGRTPIDSSATNVSVRQIVFAGREVGIYGGTGFGRPSEEPGDESLSISCHEVSLTLLDASSAFQDLITPGLLEGSIAVNRDDALARRLRYATSQVVTNRLGYVRHVRATQTIARNHSASP